MSNFYFYTSKIIAPFINFTNLFIFLIIFLIIFNFIYKNQKLKNLLKILSLVFIFIAVFPVGNFGLKILESNYINQQDIKKIENIFILGGPENLEATNKTNKTNLNDSSERFISSIKLALDNPNAKIFFLGGSGFLKNNKFNEIDIAKKFYSDVGFDYKRVLFIEKNRNTIECLKKINDLNVSHESNVLITSAYHMTRALIISKKFNLELIPYAVDFRSIGNKHLINKYQTYSVAENLLKIDLFISELIGIIATKIFL